MHRKTKIGTEVAHVTRDSLSLPKLAVVVLSLACMYVCLSVCLSVCLYVWPQDNKKLCRPTNFDENLGRVTYD